MFDGADFAVEPEDSVVSGLRRARDLIARPNGWCQGTLFRYSHRTRAYCASGAIWNVTRTRIQNEGMLQSFKKATSIEPGSSIPMWNDAPGREKADVVAAFDRAIAYAQLHRAVVPRELVKETVNV